MLSDLMRPFGYLSIRHSGGFLPLVNWVLPIALGALFVGVGFITPELNLFGPDGLLVRLLGFIQSLPGFYLAALAAVATFGKDGLDQEMPGEAPTVKILYHSQLVVVKLTRRRFLCMMFAYLTALSIALTLIAIVVLLFAAPSVGMPVGAYWWVAKAGFWFVYLLFVVQMLAITLWGLFYLGERLHTPD